MPRKKRDMARVDVHIPAQCRRSLVYKVMECGYVYSRLDEKSPALSRFMEDLSQKPLEWFINHFHNS